MYVMIKLSKCTANCCQNSVIIGGRLCHPNGRCLWPGFNHANDAYRYLQSLNYIGSCGCKWEIKETDEKE